MRRHALLTLSAALIGSLLIAWIEPGPVGAIVIVAVCVALANLVGAVAAGLVFMLLADEDARLGAERYPRSRRRRSF